MEFFIYIRKLNIMKITLISSLFLELNIHQGTPSSNFKERSHTSKCLYLFVSSCTLTDEKLFHHIFWHVSCLFLPSILFWSLQMPLALMILRFGTWKNFDHGLQMFKICILINFTYNLRPEQNFCVQSDASYGPKYAKSINLQGFPK